MPIAFYRKMQLRSPQMPWSTTQNGSASSLRVSCEGLDRGGIEFRIGSWALLGPMANGSRIGGFLAHCAESWRNPGRLGRVDRGRLLRDREYLLRAVCAEFHKASRSRLLRLRKHAKAVLRSTFAFLFCAGINSKIRWTPTTVGSSPPPTSPRKGLFSFCRFSSKKDTGTSRPRPAVRPARGSA